MSNEEIPQKLVATMIAQKIWKETGEMFRVWVSHNGDIRIPMALNSPRLRIQDIVEDIKDIVFERVTVHENTLVINFKFTPPKEAN
jgi:hypothetical protein